MLSTHTSMLVWRCPSILRSGRGYPVPVSSLRFQCPDCCFFRKNFITQKFNKKHTHNYTLFTLCQSQTLSLNWRSSTYLIWRQYNEVGSKVIGQNRIIILYNIIIVIEIIASINTVIQIPACINTVNEMNCI